jgi:hypothetical protein
VKIKKPTAISKSPPPMCIISMQRLNREKNRKKVLTTRTLSSH